MGDDTYSPGRERPEGWPEHYMATPSVECDHYMMWDTADGLYRCIHECGLVHEEPPERKLSTDREQSGGASE